uniref:Uncharacterized protein n=1 Tax=Panagrolaimus davidi TaxID=227884 RepID=A0A914PLT7_9BILA
MVLQLLSPFTKKFNFTDSSCVPNISFADVIKKAPNLVEFGIHTANIILDKTWIKDLLKYKNGKNFNDLNVTLHTLELDIKNLVKFVETKCSKDIEMYIWFGQELCSHDETREDNDKKLGAIEKKLEEYFEKQVKEGPHLTVGYEGVDGYVSFALDKIKKS